VLEPVTNLNHMFLGKPENARCPVPLEIPVSIEISRQERPCWRKAAILMLFCQGRTIQVQRQVNSADFPSGVRGGQAA
jgi:hypothetical protein